MTQEMTAYYARRAAEYERVYTGPRWQDDLARLRPRVAEVFAGRRVFEVACGTSYWTHVAAERPNPPASRFDAAGNRYEMRRLQDGERFEIVKNLFDRARLEALLAPHAAAISCRELQFFWLLEYTVA